MSTPATYLVDANVFSRFFRGGLENQTLRDRVIEHLPFCRLSAIVLFELEYGAFKSGVPVHRSRLVQLRSIFPEVLAFDEDAAAYTGSLRAFLENLKPNAQPIGPYDLLIAGQALALGARIVTDNTREFHRVPGLVVENWFRD